MKKICSFLFFVSLCFVLFPACSSTAKPKTLDLTTITEDVPISSISLLIRKDIDEDGMGKDKFQSFFTGNIGVIKKLLSDRGVNVNAELFLDEINENPNIEFEEIEFFKNFVVHKYSWKSQTQFETRLEFALSFVIQEDGTMPLEVNVKKDDPEYKPGYATKIMLNLRFEPK